MNQFNIEITGKLIAIIVGAVTTWNIVAGLLRHRVTRLREEYKFARDFYSDLNGIASSNEYLQQKGYFALTGDLSLSPSEARYLLKLRDPVRTIHAYSMGKGYLAFSDILDRKIAIKPGWESQWRRTVVKVTFITLYFICYLFAFSPLLLHSFGLWGTTSPFPSFVFLAAMFLPAAFFFIKAGVRVKLAEKVVKAQLA